MNKMVIIIIAVVVLLAAVGVGVYFLVLRDPGPVEVVLTTYQPGDQIVTNVYTADGTKGSLLKVVCVLFYDSAYKGEMDGNELVAFKVRDQVRRTLREMTVEFVGNVANEEAMRDLIISDLNERMEVEYFTDVMFLDIVLQ